MYRFQLLTFAMLALPLAVRAQTPSVGGCPVFPANNVWNTRVDMLPLDPNSNTYVQTIGANSPAHPEFGSDPGNGIPVNPVTGGQPKVNVTFRYQSDPGPYPIPANPLIEAGSDAHMLMVDTTNCIDYEIFSAAKNSDGTWSGGSGAIFPLNSNQLRPSGWTSADAAGLPILAGLVRYDEANSGTINHAIRFTAPVTDSRFIWPARHWASTVSGTNYPPMGERFRLKKTFNVSGFGPHVQAILNAMKTYGIILADNGAPWFIGGVPDPRWNDDELHQLTTIAGSNFEAVDESSLMIDPNSGQAAQPSAGGNPSPSPGAGVLTNQWIHLVSKNSGKCLEVSGGPANTQRAAALDQRTCSSATNQKFMFAPVSGGYEITIESSGMQVDVSGGPTATANGTPIIQWPYWGGSNEIWNPTPTGDGSSYTMNPLSSGKCMDVSGGSVADGAQVIQWACWGGDNQKWEIVPAP